MKRATVVTGVTVLGVAWLLNYKVAPHPLIGLTPATPTQGPGNPASPSAPTTAAASPSVTPSAAPTPSPSPSPSPTALNGSFTGADFPNRFGDVQVRVVISNGRVTDVQAVQLPTDRAESAYISQQVGPWLRTEALKAQSANIDIISGATYTSQSYAQSLESALQQAHLG
jgi:uncharacterized protein with FMN-binding domain